MNIPHISIPEEFHGNKYTPHFTNYLTQYLSGVSNILNIRQMIGFLLIIIGIVSAFLKAEKDNPELTDREIRMLTAAYEGLVMIDKLVNEV